MWAYHNEQLRDPAEIIAFRQGRRDMDPRLFECETEGDWWDTVRRCNITLLVTREYEHLLLALHAGEGVKATTTFLRLPHPSGM